MELVNRKGARSIKEIPSEVLTALNKGEIPTVNLVEWLAVDQLVLLENVLHAHNKSVYFPSIQRKVNALKSKTANKLFEAIGFELFKQATSNNDSELIDSLSTHLSDCVRNWATYAIASNKHLNINQLLKAIDPFAADAHFGVREIAWISIRNNVIDDLKNAITILEKWVVSEDENIRRFASEVTRPRGVWCKHINVLKEDPELAIKLLEPLKSDSSKYVRDSVGNWLNDSSKTQPDYVIGLCKRWSKESPTNETQYIIKRALRTLNKKK